MRGSAFQVYSVGTTPVQIAGASPSRRALVLTAITADIVITPQVNPAAGAGLFIPAGQRPVELCCLMVGDWLTKSLFARTSAGTATVYVIEAFDSPEEARFEQVMRRVYNG